MAITLEECNLLVNNHSLPPSRLQECLNWLRTHGVRRQNVLDNIDDDRWVSCVIVVLLALGRDAYA